MSNKSYIYALVYNDFPSLESLVEGPNEIAFYIGKAKNPDEREKQHRYTYKTGHEDKYKFIRELEQQGKEWYSVVLKEVDEEDNRPWEYWYVIDYIRKGSPLKNMRYGDLNKISKDIKSKLTQLANDRSVNNIDDLQKKLAEESMKQNYPSSRKIQYRAILKLLRFLRTEMDASVKSRKWNIYDLGDGTKEIKAEYGMKKKEIAELLLPEDRVKLDSLRRKIEEKHPLPEFSTVGDQS